MANTGFAGGLAEGIQSGMDQFLTQQKMKIDREDNAAKLKIEMGFKGLNLTKDPKARQEFIDKYIVPGLGHFSGRPGFPTEKETKAFAGSIDLTNPADQKLVGDIENVWKQFQKDNLPHEKAFEMIDVLRSSYKGDDLTEGQEQRIGNIQRNLGVKYAQHIKGQTPLTPVTADEKAGHFGTTGMKWDEIYPETETTAPKYDVVENLQTGEQKYLKKGGSIPPGWKVTKPSSVEINIGGKSALTPATTTQVQKQIMEGRTNLDKLSDMEELFKPEYLTYLGKGKAFTQKGLDKLGVGTDTEFLEKRQQWYQGSKANFLAYRKWVTGVAGGEKEMAEIAKSYPDPDNNSPAQFRANLKQVKITTTKLIKRYKSFLAMGITPTGAQLASVPLSSIKITPGDSAQLGNKRTPNMNTAAEFLNSIGY